jgi:hypothetical protein
MLILQYCDAVALRTARVDACALATDYLVVFEGFWQPAVIRDINSVAVFADYTHVEREQAIIIENV